MTLGLGLTSDASHTPHTPNPQLSRETQHTHAAGLGREAGTHRSRPPHPFPLEDSGTPPWHPTQGPAGGCVHRHGDMGQAQSRHVTEAGTLGYTQRTVQTHPDVGRQTRPLRTRTQGGWLAGRGALIELAAHSRAQDTNALRWANTGAALECQTPPRIPWPALGN